ncbi:MAG: zf-HC2 domain-containing protein [Bacteroidetes bacterium]|nr:zf-HC2 domain-containing protein [Bacteroidota bacterium]MCL5025375.1 zf-HC2 domain-containing protein [Chloroflexota bacterium]
MGCEKPGVLRAYLDNELDAAAASRVEAHLAACPGCRLALEQVRANASAVASRLEALEPSTAGAAEQARAWAAIQSRLHAGRAIPSHIDGTAFNPNNGLAGAGRTGQPGGMWTMISNALSLRQRAALAAGLVALLLAGAMMLPAGRAAAVDFLNLFRVQKFVAVSVDPSRPFNAFAYLERIGKVTLPQGRGVGSLTTAPLAEVDAKAGIKLQRPTIIPPGVSDRPQVRVIPAAEASFTLDRQKTEAYLKSSGAANPSVPAKYDGARLVVKVPTAVTMTYVNADAMPRLIIGQLASPTATVEGKVSLGELREFLLGLPGLPPDTVAQLRAINDWTQTLPVPVPRDRAVWHDVSLGGTPALAVTDPSAGASGVIWQRDGVVYGVAGLSSEQQLLEIVRSLK